MNLLAIRLSAMGDVALTLPAIRSVLDQHPDVSITLVTRKIFFPFFNNIPRLTCVEADVKGRHKGVPGLYRLYKTIYSTYRPDAVIDLHDVLRSHILSFFFKLSGIPVYRIDKGRQEKKQLTARHEKHFHRLTHTVQRYLDVFNSAGGDSTLSSHTNWFNAVIFPESFLQQTGALPKKNAWIGIAPFAKHREKMWPMAKMEELMASLHKQGVTMFLFGGGAKEIDLMNQLSKKYTHSVVVAGKLSLQEELGLIGRLDVMVSMDSANMHLAALSGIPVVSIWGATHPFAGFGPLHDNEKNIVEIPHDQLTCRPCSVFGNKPCWRGDHACMEWITPAMVLEKVKAVRETIEGERD